MSREILVTVGITALIELLIAVFAPPCFAYLYDVLGIVIVVLLHIMQMIVVYWLYFQGVRGAGMLLAHAAVITASSYIGFYLCRSAAMAETNQVTIGETAAVIILCCISTLYLVASLMILWFRK